MADEDREYSEEEEEEEKEESTTTKVEEKKKDEPKKEEQTISEAELAMEKMRKKKEEEEALWNEYIEQRKIQKAKEEEDLRKLKERQSKRKERRAEEEKRLMAQRKQQEAQRVKEMEEKREREAEAKRKRLEEAERKRQALKEAMSKQQIDEPVTPNFVINKRNEDGVNFSGVLINRNEVVKTKEQLQEDKRIAMTIRVKPLHIEALSVTELKQKADEMWNAIVRLESEKYDLEQRQKRQEYDLKELSERQRQINRSKALKKGLDPDALSGKFPPMINVASKYERRLDRRSFNEKKSLYEGGYMSNYETSVANQWEDKVKNFKERGPSKLLKWDPSAPKIKETPEPRHEEEDDDDDDLVGPPFLGVGSELDSNPLEVQNGNEDQEEEEEEEDEEEEEE